MIRQKPLRVCYFGTYESDYPRNRLLIESLTEGGLEVHQCHVEFWYKLKFKHEMCRGLGGVVALFQILVSYPLLICRYLTMPAHDLLMVGYAGHLDMILAWALARIRSVPVVFDPLVSLHDTFCVDRALVRPGSPLGLAFRWLDRVSCRLADLVLVDTEPHRDYFSAISGEPPGKFLVVPVGAEERLFSRRPARPADPGRTYEVLFVGKLIPLHGCEAILRAAARLHSESIHFTLIGSGQEGPTVHRLVQELSLTNVTLIEWVDYEGLPDWYAAADICLGIFGDSEKAGRVVPNKLYQGLAIGRPVITRDSPAVRGLFNVGDEVWPCRAADPTDLAAQILHLARDEALRCRIAEAGHVAFRESFDGPAIARRVIPAFESLLGVTAQETPDSPIRLAGSGSSA